MRTRAILATCLAGLCLASGCAQARSTATYHTIGLADATADARTVARWEETRRQKAPGDVRVYVAAIPDGLSVTDGSLTVDEGTEHRILGRFRISPTRHQYGTYLFTEYEHAAVAAACYPQVILTWATLGLWVIVPTSWGCLTNGFQPREALVDQARHLARAAGGNAVVAAFEDSTGHDDAQALTGVILNLSPESNGSTPYTGPASNFLDEDAVGPDWQTESED